MHTQSRLTTATMIALSIALVTGCSKSEPAASAASTTAAPAPDPQPTPGSPVATFVPANDTPSPMLPTLDSSMPETDPHGLSTSSADAPRIGPEEAAMLVQSGDAILLDVRTVDAFAAGHIKGAVNIPLAEIASRASAELTPTRWIIPYCT